MAKLANRGGSSLSAMVRRQNVIVVGAGLGGLSAAAHLAGRGYEVSLVERGDRPGGRAGQIQQAGYTFDTGPTVLTMPDIIEGVFAAMGRSMADFVQLEPVDPIYRACFADGSVINMRAGREAMTDEIRSTCGAKDAAAFGRFCNWLGRLYDVEMPNFIDRNYDSPLDLVRPLQPAVKLARLGAFRRLGGRVALFFDDDRLRRLFSFQSLYAGLAPHEALAVYGVITYMDSVQGVFFPRGGMHAVAQGLADALEKSGVSIRYEAPVEAVLRDNSGAVCGIALADGEKLLAGAVVCNPDLPAVYRTLLDVAPPRVVSRGTYSPSCVVWHVGVEGRAPIGGAHHNVHFGSSWKQAFRTLLHDGERMPDPSILVTVPTTSDPSLAPEGRSVLYVLEPVPNLDGHVDWNSELPKVRDELYERIGALGYPTTIETEHIVGPLDWEREGMERGTPFALSHRFLQSGPFRPGNVEKSIPGLVFVGSGTVPGVGVPMVLISGRLAAERVEQVLS